jgi:hypothetical protein
MNVIEHIESDSLAVRNASKLLGSEGRLVILVPALQWLYNRLDRELGHYRRYTANSVRQLLVSQGMQLIDLSYFNPAAIPGWWFSGTVLKRKLIPERSLKLFNSLVGLLRLVDPITRHALGISVIAVAGKASCANKPVT